MPEAAWKVGERANRKQYSLEKDAHIGEAGTDGTGRVNGLSSNTSCVRNFPNG